MLARSYLSERWDKKAGDWKQLILFCKLILFFAIRLSSHYNDISNRALFLSNNAQSQACSRKGRLGIEFRPKSFILFKQVNSGAFAFSQIEWAGSWQSTRSRYPMSRRQFNDREPQVGFNGFSAGRIQSGTTTVLTDARES